MAAIKTVAGDDAVYLVTPLLGGLVIWLMFVFGSSVADRRTGCTAAVLFAFTPLFVFHALIPMSDVPATAWWLLAWVFALAMGQWAPFWSGIASSAAILTRPNIAPLALVLAAFIVSRSGVRHAMMYVAGVLPSTFFIAALNQYLYGSPVSSGHGPLDTLFDVRYLTTNLKQFWTWLIDLHTPAVLVGVLAFATGRVKRAWWMLAFSMALLACYLFYLPLDNWTFLRFLLPALPLLVIFDASVGVSLIERMPLALRGAAAFALCTLVPFWFVTKTHSLGIFEVSAGARRYATVGDAVGRRVPSDAVIISMNHSGSLRLYGDRASIRWDLIDPDRLDDVIADVRTHGHTPYFLLEDWEETRVRDRFGRFGTFGKLDWPPAAEYLGHGRACLYAVDDRQRYLRGERVLPNPIP